MSDRARLEQVLRRDPWLHLYELGDLDDTFFPRTTFFALAGDGDVDAVALLYAPPDSLPVLLALDRDADRVVQLLERAQHALPARFYAHLTPGVTAALHARFRLLPHGTHAKMGLIHPEHLDAHAGAEASPLGVPHRFELEAFYAESFPGNWFDPRTLEMRTLATGVYFGVRRNGVLVSAAGVHVYSARFRVAALGNVITHPSFRGRGFARDACVALCRALRPTTDHVGLNVAVENERAIALYESLGFERVALYEEFIAESRG